ncbi:hypothetical protein AB0C69_41045, partial [Actinomadura sp. NPDC048032]|uniref:hypothetical protein n=1 Tax=Actinomadura sp. NPDC048032 TaxID=3155747 RepID=UPI0033EE3F99
SRADLYVLRPTGKSLPAAGARADRFATAIYTRGGLTASRHNPRRPSHHPRASLTFRPHSAMDLDKRRRAGAS